MEREQPVASLARISLLTALYPFLMGGLLYSASSVPVEVSSSVVIAMTLSIPAAALVSIGLAVCSLVWKRGTRTEAILGLVLGLCGLAGTALLTDGILVLGWLLSQIQW